MSILFTKVVFERNELLVCDGIQYKYVQDDVTGSNLKMPPVNVFAIRSFPIAHNVPEKFELVVHPEMIGRGGSDVQLSPRSSL